MPWAAQVRLLRVLQDHQIERVGGKQTIHVDVRIVTATHRDLSNMVRERTFREDLWYRINVFPIYLPRLRDRVEDLPLLVRHFAQRAASRFGLPFVEPSAADLLTLASYGWPGNIRELGAVIDRAVILGKGQSLEVAAALGLSDDPRPVADSGPTFYEVIPESNSSRSAGGSEHGNQARSYRWTMPCASIYGEPSRLAAARSRANEARLGYWALIRIRCGPECENWRSAGASFAVS